MKNCITYLIVFLLAGSFVSCYETDSDILVPKYPRKLVLSSFISPNDTTIDVIVSHSFPLNDTSNNSDLFVTNATVVITSATASDTLEYDEFRNGYSLPTTGFPVEPGASYRLDVSTPDGLKVSAQCTTPEPQVLDFTYHIDSVVSGNNKQYIINMKWNDIPGEKVYYRSFPQLLYCYRSDTIFTCSSSYFTSSGKSVFEGNAGSEEFSITYKSDIIPKASTSMIIMQLISIDKDYFELYKTLDNQYVPVTEPIYTYTNVNDGLGIFASYNSKVEKRIVY